MGLNVYLLNACVCVHSILNGFSQTFFPGQFTVAEWLTHSPAKLEVTGSHPTFDGISEVCFSNRCGL